MRVLIRIAIRNLLEHRAKTLIIGIIIALGIVVLIVGNSLMDTAALGIRKGFIDNYTGDVMISGLSENEISLFGVQSPGGLEDTPTLPNHDTIRSYLSENDFTESVASQITGYAQMAYGELEGRSFTILFGVEPDSYRSMFDNIVFTDGRDLEPQEEGIVISRERLDDLVESIREEAEKEASRNEDAVPLDENFDIGAGDEIRLTSFGNAGIKIRVVPIVGVFEFLNPAEGLGIDLISYLDVQTIRALNGLTIGFQGEFDLEESQTELLDAENVDDLFSESFEVTEAEYTQFDSTSLDDILGDTTVRNEALELDTGSWQYILVKVKNRRKVERSISTINEWLAESKIPAQAANWEVAAGPFAQTADVIRKVFNVAIIIVGIVALIIMVNTLVISVIERTGEIGTMRALGARRGFVWRMFLVETVTITSVFGIIGIAVSFLIVGILNLFGIPATNVFLRVLFAGDALHPTVSAVSVFSAVLISTIVGLLAHVYPVSVALKIQPIKAMQTE